MEYTDGFGRSGRFGILAPPAPRFDDSPRVRGSRPVLAEGETPAPNISGAIAPITTPGGYANNLRQAGVSRGYATKRALEMDRRQQGHMNVYTPQARADIYAAPLTGDPQFSVRREGMQAVNEGVGIDNNFRQRMTAPLVDAQNIDNQSGKIRNQYAPGMLQSQIDSRNADTQSTVGKERRAQGEFDLTAPYMAPKAAAEVDRFGAQTGQIKAETKAVDRDYQGEIARYRADAERANQALRQQEIMMRTVMSELRSLRQAAGRDTSDIDGLDIGNGGQPSTGKPAPPAGKGGGNSLDEATIDAILQESGGDPNKAAQIARSRGYQW